jgi:predicted transposase/invertase (TIGR01784 family)
VPRPEISIKHPYDSFFKKLFDNEENIRDFLRVYLPKDLVKNLDFESIKISDTEKENKKHKKYYLDLCVDCLVSETQSKIYIIFEHKSYHDKLTLIQTMNYCLTIWESEIENHQKYLTPIVPFIFYHGKTKSKLKKNFREYFEPNSALDGYLMDFKFVIFDTTQIENHDIMKSINNLYLSASLLLMKNIFKNVAELKPVLKEIVMLDDERVIRLFEYIVVNKDIKKEELKELIIEMKGEDTMPTLAQRWLDEGKAEGRVEGIQIGMQRGLQTGVQQGIQQGIQQGVFETTIVMMKDFQIAIDDVVAKLNIKKEELLEYMKMKQSKKL